MLVGLPVILSAPEGITSLSLRSSMFLFIILYSVYWIFRLGRLILSIAIFVVHALILLWFHKVGLHYFSDFGGRVPIAYGTLSFWYEYIPSRIAWSLRPDIHNSSSAIIAFYIVLGGIYWIFIGRGILSLFSGAIKSDGFRRGCGKTKSKLGFVLIGAHTIYLLLILLFAKDRYNVFADQVGFVGSWTGPIDLLATTSFMIGLFCLSMTNVRYLGEIPLAHLMYLVNCLVVGGLQWYLIGWAISLKNNQIKN